jgi:hypothetical protein
MKDKLKSLDGAMSTVAQGSSMGEQCKAEGVYSVKCFDGETLVWEDTFDNVVTYVGQNLMLSSSLQGSGYTVTGPYMGLISSVGWSATAVTDTMSSHAGWTEAGGTNAPTFAARVAPAFSAPSSGAIATSAAVSFTMTGNGTLEGAFIVYGSGATNVVDSTTGTLLSAGAFSGGAQPVNSGNVVQVTYSLTL